MDTASVLKTTGLPVSIERVSKSYGKFQAIRDVSIDVEAGTIVSLLGPSGCGKTTVLRMVAGLEVPSAGTIRVGDRILNNVPVWKRGIGMVFQSYALFPHMTVAENIAFGLRMKGLSAVDAQPGVRQAMDLTRLSTLADRLPSQLSGGQRQRVALARALANSPTLLLLDEPLGALDKKLRDQMQVELKQLQRRVGLSTIIVTHDQDEALTLSDRVVVMSNGHVEQVATPTEIYRTPVNAFVAGFIGAANLLAGDLLDRGTSSSTIRLRTGHTIKATGVKSDAAKDSSVTVLIRPETIRLQAEDSADAASNSVRARITNILFSGPNTNYVLDVEGTELLASVPSNRQGGPVGAVNETVTVVWNVADTVIVPE